MFVRNRVLPFALFAALSLLLLPTGSRADDRKTADKGADTKADKGGHGHVYVGRIESAMDKDGKHVLVLKDAHRRDRKGGKGGREGTAADADKGTKAKGQTIRFHVSGKAEIKLNGKTATFAELKPGQWARVHEAAHGTKKGGGDKDKAGADAGKKHHHHADRVHAFSKRPERGKGAGAGTAP